MVNLEDFIQKVEDSKLKATFVNPLVKCSIKKYHDALVRIAEKGICFNISPRDDILNTQNEKFIKSNICKILDRTNSLYMLIPEYNGKGARLHYHGAIIIKDYETLTKVKRSIYRAIGRSDTEQCTNSEGWAEYCFKSYEDNEKVKNNIYTNDKDIKYQPLGQPITIFKEEHVIYPKKLTM